MMIDAYAIRRALAPTNSTSSVITNDQTPSVQKGKRNDDFISVSRLSKEKEKERLKAINDRLGVDFSQEIIGDASTNLPSSEVGKFSLPEDNASNIKDPESPTTIKSALKGSTKRIEFNPKSSPSATTSSNASNKSEEESDNENNSVFRKVGDDSPLVINEGKKSNNEINFSLLSSIAKKEPAPVQRDSQGRPIITPAELQEVQGFMKTDKLIKMKAYPQLAWASEKLAAAKEDLEKANVGLAWAKQNTDFNQEYLSAWRDLAQERYENAAAFDASVSKGPHLDLYDPATSSKDAAPSWSRSVDLATANIKQVVDSCAQAAKAEEKANFFDQQRKELCQVGHDEESEEVFQLEKNYREADEQRRASAYQAQSLYKATFSKK